MKTFNEEICERQTPSNDPGDGFPFVMVIPNLIVSSISVVHAIGSRSLHDFVKYGSYIIALWMAIFSIIIFALVKDSKLPKLKKRHIWLVLLGIIIIPVLAAVHYSVLASIKDLFLWTLSPTRSSGAAVIFASIITLAIGGALFYFRLRFRAVYGLTETTIGVVVAASRMTSEDAVFTSTSFYLAILTASVYLVVRGLDNIHQGFTKDPKDPYAAKLRRFLLNQGDGSGLQ